MWYWAITVLQPCAYDRAVQGGYAVCGIGQWTVLWPWAYDRAVQRKCAGLVQTPVTQPILPGLGGSCQPSKWCTNTPLTQGLPKMVATTCRGLVKWIAHGVLWPWAYDRAVQGNCAGLVQTPVKQPILPELRGSCQPSRWCTNTPLTQGHPKMVAATCWGLVQWTAHGVLWPWAFDRAVQGKCAGLVQTPVKQPILPELRGSCQPWRWCTNTPLTQGHPKMVAATCRGLVQWTGVLWPWADDRAVQGKCAVCGIGQWTVLWPWAYDRAVQGNCAGVVQTPVK